MKTTDLFKNNRSSKKINESIEKIFGKKINLESFNLEQLQDARNKLRTQIHDARSQSGFNETIENEALTQAQWMLDAINAEIAERDEFVVDSDVQEGYSSEVEEFLQKVAQDGNYDMLNDAQNGKYGPEIEQAVQDMYNDVSADFGLHPDDDFEEIYDKMLDNIELDYSDSDRDPDEGGETDDAYAMASAGFGSDEDYGDYGNNEYESIEEKGNPQNFTKKDKEPEEKTRPSLSQYQDPNVLDLTRRARADSPHLDNDQEAVLALFAKQDKILQTNIKTLQKQNKDQEDEIKALEKDNKELQSNLIKQNLDQQEQEKRFQDLTAKIAAQDGQATPQQISAAKAAQQLEKEYEPKRQQAQQFLKQVGSKLGQSRLGQSRSTESMESIGKPKLSRIHYFQVSSNDRDLAAQLGLKQDKGGNWVLYQFDKSGVPFNQTFAKAVNMFGRPKSISVSENMNPVKKVDIPAVMRKKSGDPNWKVTQQDLEKDKEQTATTAQGISAKKKQLGVDTMEVAPPTAKGERMVKHIKKGYADDGKLTKKEKGIAYATAWKQHNKSKNESQQVDELSRDTVKSYAEKKKAVISQNPPTTKQQVGKDLKGVKGALERLRGIKPTSESTELGENMTKLTEGEVQQASAIVTAKTMVDRVGRWIEELSGMENDTLLNLGDSIRDEMGQEQAKNFISAVAPAIQAALENLKATRETLATGVRSLTGEEQPAEMLGAEPGSDESELGAASPDEMNMPAEEPAADEFAAAEPAAGGLGDAGREQRESIDYQNRLLKVLAG